MYWGGGLRERGDQFGKIPTAHVPQDIAAAKQRAGSGSVQKQHWQLPGKCVCVCLKGVV